MEKTLREVCTAIKVSRRAVQGYEEAGLVSATGHNDRGYLLYDESAQRRIAQIKMYQDFGFMIKEIVRIIDAPKAVLKASLEKRVLQLEAEKERLKHVIRQAYELIGQL
ncbi:MAG: MerR family transcriptional regulator [Lachnospiraceae bacterium]|nr:MerR family transcriptional regulator [Lachnospiraceae bacterium]